LLLIQGRGGYPNADDGRPFAEIKVLDQAVAFKQGYRFISQLLLQGEGVGAVKVIGKVININRLVMVKAGPVFSC